MNDHMKDEIRRAFAPLHARQQAPQEVLSSLNGRPAPPAWRRVTAILIAAAAALTATACAAGYVLGHRDIYFFDTQEELAAKQSANHPGCAVSMAIPGSAEENFDLETPAQYVARAMEDGLLENETVISREENDGTLGDWEHRVIRECHSELYGDVITEYRTSASYAMGFVSGLEANWDLSFLTQEMTPDKGSQILILCRNRTDGTLKWEKAHLGYTTASGGRFSLSYSYDPSFVDYGQLPEYILSDAYDENEIFVTTDGVEVLVQAYDGQVWAIAAHGYKSVSLYASSCTIPEMEAILNQLSLACILS